MATARNLAPDSYVLRQGHQASKPPPHQGSHQVPKAEKQKLMARLKGLGELNKYKITLSGHCDNIGESIYNDHLSDFRVKAVAAYLQEVGIKVDQIETITFGERMPAKSNTNKAGRQLNRRVEVIFTIPN
jgi:outer membrane protein OmpA-like peptidoglycan-associated protein